MGLNLGPSNPYRNLKDMALLQGDLHLQLLDVEKRGRPPSRFLMAFPHQVQFETASVAHRSSIVVHPVAEKKKVRRFTDPPQWLGNLTDAVL